MNQRTKSLLGLQAYQVLATRRLNSQEEEVVVALPNTGFCPHCRAPTTTVHQVQPQASRLLWSFVNGHRLWLVVLRRIRESNKS